MEDIIADFLSWPPSTVNIISAGICGLASAIIGSLLSYPIKRVFKADRTAKVVFFISLFILFPNFNANFVPALEKIGSPNLLMKEVEKNGAVQIIFRYHPEAEKEMKTSVRSIIQALPSYRSGIMTKEAILELKTAIAQIISKYFMQHLAFASDEAVYSFIFFQKSLANIVRRQPDLCVKFINGAVEHLTKEDNLDALNVMTMVLESSITNPSPPPSNVNPEQITQALTNIYTQNGYPLDDLVKLGQLSSLPNKEACEIGIRFEDTLLSLPPKNAAYIFKSLLILSN